MAAPLVAIKAGVEGAKVANVLVKRFMPGGWYTVVGIVIIVVIVLPVMLVYSVMSSFSMSMGDETFCGVNGYETGATTADGHTHGSGGTDTGYGRHKGPAQPFPSEDSSAIVWPIKASNNPSGYGPRTPIRTGSGVTNAFHDGSDFGAPMGTPIVSMADGIVSMATKATGTQEGSMVEVQHKIKGQTYTTAYRHVQGKSVTVKIGDSVKAGQQIASVGSEGYSTGPHLHFVVAKGSYHRYNSTKGPAGTVDPVAFLKSNGAATASGGLAGDDFSGGVGTDPASTECDVSNNVAQLPGDGTTKWSAYENGEFPADELGSAGGVQLYNEAATQLKNLMAQYKKDTGSTLQAKTGYLSLAAQKKRYDAGTQIEKPGQSVFGWARIVDLNLGKKDSVGHKWMQANASKFGFEQPSMFSGGGSGENIGMWAYMGGVTAIPPAANANAENNRQTAKTIIASKYPGWGSGEYACLVTLWEGESNWNHLAENPSSGAYGIVQALPPSKMNSFGTDWRTNPQPQILWGLDYIEGRYGTPCEALAFWNETDPSKKFGYPGHWY